MAIYEICRKSIQNVVITTDLEAVDAIFTCLEAYMTDIQFINPDEQKEADELGKIVIQVIIEKLEMEVTTHEAKMRQLSAILVIRLIGHTVILNILHQRGKSHQIFQRLDISGSGNLLSISKKANHSPCWGCCSFLTLWWWGGVDHQGGR